MLLVRTIRGSPSEYFQLWQRSENSERGMDRWRDIIDWVGGYPFEVASREAIIGFCTRQGFELERLISVGRSHGCNQFVFERKSGAGD